MGGGGGSWKKGGGGGGGEGNNLGSENGLLSYTIFSTKSLCKEFMVMACLNVVYSSLSVFVSFFVVVVCLFFSFFFLFFFGGGGGGGWGAGTITVSLNPGS